MSRSATWPGNAAADTLSAMDSAGSCDSVISMNSVHSDDSMEHLSAEEKACLMFLEETIEALELQEDSGLSNDEPDTWSKTETNDQIRTDVSSLTSESGFDGMSSSLTLATPAPAAGERQWLELSPEARPPHTSAADTTAVNMEAQAHPPFLEAPDGAMSSSAETVSVVLDADPDSTTCASSTPEQPTEIDVGLIPPPMDFMDEPDTGLPEQTDPNPPPAETPTKPEGAAGLEQQPSPASVGKASESFDAFEAPPSPSQTDDDCIPPLSPPSEFLEPKSPPTVAPKPKKLPPSILLKSQKASASERNSGHTVQIPGGLIVLDQDKVRQEALRKLGLLKNSEPAARVPLKATGAEGSWKSPPPTSPITAFAVSSPTAPTPLQPASPSGGASAILDPDIVPAPEAFSDHTGAPSGRRECPAVMDNTDGTPPPALVKLLPPPKVANKSSLNSSTSRQGFTGLSKSVRIEQSPKELRKTRPRPASLGSGKELAKAEAPSRCPASGSQTDLNRSRFATGAHQHPAESPKLPRSQGISVLICPRAQNEEDRREALRKLGLLRD